MKFLIDADTPIAVCNAIKELGHEAAHVREVGLGNAADSEILKYALQNNTVLITKDVEFGNPLVHPDASCGIVILRIPSSFNSIQISSVAKDFVKNMDINLLKGSVFIVELGRYRIRK